MNGTNGDNETHVWVRQELVEVLLKNKGSLPKGWKPSRKRGRTSDQDLGWGWVRAKATPQSSHQHGHGHQHEHASSSSLQLPESAPSPSRTKRNPYGHVQLRKTQRPSTSSVPTSPTWGSPRKRSVLPHTSLQLLVDDTDFAPDYLQHRAVHFQPDPERTDSLVVRANAWWRQTGEVPPVDLTSLTHLHEPAVVYCLQRRYDLDEIYTYTGKILLALNPFRRCPDLYGEHVMERYWNNGMTTGGAAGGGTTNVDDLVTTRPQPHIYATAQDAYGCMMRSMGWESNTAPANSSAPAVGRNQSILVSGESGAGKTVTTKIIMSYLTTLSRRHMKDSTAAAHQPIKAVDDRGVSNNDIESQVLQSNPILESFGNARTLRNDNSSRFGKFIEIRFNRSGCVVAATIETYLLEKVRLITQTQGERNYHIFYELLVGMSQKERRDLLVGNRSAYDYRMTGSSGTFDRRDGVDDRT